MVIYYSARRRRFGDRALATLSAIEPETYRSAAGAHDE